MRLNEHKEQLILRIFYLNLRLNKESDPCKISQLINLINGTRQLINEINNQSNQSKYIINNLTDDIKNLNTVKTNLNTSMSVLKKIQMIVNISTQISDQINEHSYSTVIRPLDELNKLSDNLSHLARVPKVADMLTQAQMIQAKLKEQVLREFKSYWSSSSSNLPSMGGERERKKIKDSALVIDKLGNEVRVSLIDWFINHLLKDYKKIFNHSDEAGQLDNLSTRFTWFNKCLSLFNDQQALSHIWPSAWDVDKKLLSKFASYT